MGSAHPTTSAVEFLAAALDDLTADRWHERDAAYAWLDRGGEVGLGTPPDREVVAASVTSLASSRRIDPVPVAEVQPVRITLSVSCCSAFAVVRHPDGKIDRSGRVDGPTAALLRGWASLHTCPSCVGAVADAS